MRALDQGTHFTPNDCILWLTSQSGEASPHKVTYNGGKGKAGEERIQREVEVRGKGAMSERSP